jgi:hypothetical protein
MQFRTAVISTAQSSQMSRLRRTRMNLGVIPAALIVISQDTALRFA